MKNLRCSFSINFNVQLSAFRRMRLPDAPAYKARSHLGNFRVWVSVRTIRSGSFLSATRRMQTLTQLKHCSFVLILPTFFTCFHQTANESVFKQRRCVCTRVREWYLFILCVLTQGGCSNSVVLLAFMGPWCCYPEYFLGVLTVSGPLNKTCIHICVGTNVLHVDLNTPSVWKKTKPIYILRTKKWNELYLYFFLLKIDCSSQLKHQRPDPHWEADMSSFPDF